MLIFVNPREFRVKVNSDLLEKFLFPPRFRTLATSRMEKQGEYSNSPRFPNLHYRNWILNDSDNINNL